MADDAVLFTAAQAAGILQIHGVLGAKLLEGMDDDQIAGIGPLQAECFLVMREAIALASEADQATGNGTAKARKPRPKVLPTRS
jgi:hypothetical protein